MHKHFGKFILAVLILIAAVVIVWVANNKYYHPTVLRAIEETITVDGKQSKVFNLVQPDGAPGYVGMRGDYFNVLLKNDTSVPISIHWHGLILPNDQDGVPYVTQLPIPPGKSHRYYFKLKQSGTYWMHSHFRFHEQQLMSAPLILNEPDDEFEGKDITVMLNDFTFKNPETVFNQLKHPASNLNMAAMKSRADLNDVKYDNYLANRHTLDDPAMYDVQPGQQVKLRLINGASASNFWVTTGKLSGLAVAIDGNLIQPIIDNTFQLGSAQRVDVIVTIPKTGGVFPILAQAEGTNKQTGILLVTPNARIPKLSSQATTKANVLNSKQELRFHAIDPLEDKRIEKTLHYKLSGDMNNYVWRINEDVWPIIRPLVVNEDTRVEMVFTNDTGMSHPMHFHGHVFQVTEIDGKPIENGPLRDTILVLPHQTQKIVFDADNPGVWMMHCHILYHMAAGMMTTTNYEGYVPPRYYSDLITGKVLEYAPSQSKFNVKAPLH